MANAYNKAVFQFEIAKQSAKGVPAAAPAYFMQATGGTMSGNRTDGEVQVGDGLVFSRGYVYADKVEAGGSPVLVASPKDLALLIHAILGTDTPSGAGDPWTHVITPNNASGTTPWYTIWKRVDALWELFPDCKVTALEIKASVDQKIMQVTPTIVSASATQKIAAPSSATAETVAFDWWDAQGSWTLNALRAHQVYNATTGAPFPKAVDLASLVAAANDLRTKYMLHYGAHTTAPHGKGNDATNIIAAAAVTDLATAQTFLNEFKGDFNAHRILLTAHYFADNVHVIGSTNGSDLATNIVLCNESVDKYNRHTGLAPTIRDFTLTINRGFEPYYGQDLTPVDVVEGRGSISLSCTLLFDEDSRALYDWIMYGSPTAAAGTELTGNIVNGSFQAKFFQTATAPEKSVSFSIPTMQFEASGLGDQVSGDPGGGPMMMTVVGRAAGTAPILTATILNDVATY